MHDTLNVFKDRDDNFDLLHNDFNELFWIYTLSLVYYLLCFFFVLNLVTLGRV